MAISNAAKDDTIGFDGDFNFNLADLFQNDASHGQMLDKTNTKVGPADGNYFYFGTPGTDQYQYMHDHGISFTDTGFTVAAGNDFDYSVLVGNKNTWSTAHVDVADAPEAVDSFDFGNVTNTESSMTDLDLYMTAQPETDTGYNSADVGLTFDTADVGLTVDAFQHSDFLV